MEDVPIDPNDLLRQVETVSRSQRALFGEFERQRSRLEQVVRWYDHQQTARRSELSRQSEQILKESRKKLHFRSSMTISERTRLQHKLDNDSNNLLTSIDSTSISNSKNPAIDKKRKAYGCLLPQLKAPLKPTSDSEKPVTSNSTEKKSNFHPFIERKQDSIRKPIDSPTEQRHQIDTVLNKCLYQLEQCNGDGYDHFLQMSEPMRNAQILAQQNINHKSLRSN